MRRTVGTIAERMLRDETPEFFDDFWSKLERRERVAARRWRRAAFALAAVAIAALATAGVVAAPFGHRNAVDASMVCSVDRINSFRGIGLAAVAARPHNDVGRPPEAQLVLTTGGFAGQGTVLFQADAALRGYLLNQRSCTRSDDSSAPRPTGLRLTDLMRAGTPWGHEYRCAGVGRVRLSVHLVEGKDDVPTAARLVVQRVPGKKPLLYVDWAPNRVYVYISPACETTDIGF